MAVYNDSYDNEEERRADLAWEYRKGGPNDPNLYDPNLYEEEDPEEDAEEEEEERPKWETAKNEDSPHRTI